MLHINDLIYRVGGRVLFDAATLALRPGEKVGLVGPNGAGKTTLLRLIEGKIETDSGRIAMRRGMRRATVAQEAPDGPESLIETVLAADVERSALLTEADTATEAGRIADIHTRLADIDAHSAPARAAAILAGLGFDSDAQTRPCASFSGGWRMRVALAATLFTAPDLLLLDEPSNHLDLEARLWLESHLAKYRGAVLLVSHDRDLLDKVAQRIVHLENRKLVSYRGNYAAFDRVRREKQALQAKLRTRQLDQRRRIEGFVTRFRAQASKARQAQSRVKALERMAPIADAIEDRAVAFDFPQPAPLPPPLITLDDVSVGYESATPVLAGLDLRIDGDDRIALLGANGNGKSTLARLLARRLDPMSGSVRRPPKLRVGYFAQHQAEELDMNATPFAILSVRMKMATGSQIRAHLGRFGFSGNVADQRIGDLSGGEKSRLLFALISRDAPQILILDEPTNHLDIESREALTQALNAYNGAVVLISHDPHLIALCADRLWEVADGTCRAWDGDLEDYRRALLDSRRASARTGRAKDAPARLDRREVRRAAA
ncbi:MAG: ABC-F family ATP-binding cassette domain-containing protein, partial [Alphaproteobacteria bacterium]